MNRSLPAAPDPPMAYNSLQRMIDGEGLNTSGRIKSYIFNMVQPIIMNSEDATMLPRINFTVAGIVFCVIMATRSRMLTVKMGMRKNRIFSIAKKGKSAVGSSKDMKLSLLLLLVILYSNLSVNSHNQNSLTLEASKLFSYCGTEHIPKVTCMHDCHCYQYILSCICQQ